MRLDGALDGGVRRCLRGAGGSAPPKAVRSRRAACLLCLRIGAVDPGAGAPVVAWEQARNKALHALSQLGPLAPGTSVDCVPRPREASFDAGKAVLLLA